jgi:hypothetical protein
MYEDVHYRTGVGKEGVQAGHRTDEDKEAEFTETVGECLYRALRIRQY